MKKVLVIIIVILASFGAAYFTLGTELVGNFIFLFSLSISFKLFGLEYMYSGATAISLLLLTILYGATMYYCIRLLLRYLQ